MDVTTYIERTFAEVALKYALEDIETRMANAYTMTSSSPSIIIRQLAPVFSEIRGVCKDALRKAFSTNSLGFFDTASRTRILSSAVEDIRGRMAAAFEVTDSSKVKALNDLASTFGEMRDICMAALKTANIEGSKPSDRTERDVETQLAASMQ